MPSATAHDIRRVARALGFVRQRQTGSHQRWNHADGRAVTIPLHGSREIGPPLIYKISIAVKLGRERGHKVTRRDSSEI